MAAGAPWGIRPIGSNALNLARIEAGFIIANVDFVPADQALREDRPRSPFEIGLDWMIDWQKGHFNGRRALLAETGTGRPLAGRWWRSISRATCRPRASLLYHGKTREVGYITAAVWSPATKAQHRTRLVAPALGQDRGG